MQRLRPLVLLLSTLLAQTLAAQSPFQFREAALLAGRMWRSGQDFSAGHSQLAGRESTFNSFRPDANDLQVYRSDRWVGLLSETDSYRRNGALVLAEKQYLDLLAKLRQVRGPEDLDIAWMLDHLAEFYLGTRDFDTAYQNFDAALRLRRTNIQSLGQSPQAAPALQMCRAHLVRLLVALGRLDAAKGDAVRAQTEYAEAVTLGNQLVRLQDGLHAIYFQSRLLEKQNKWRDAEGLWLEGAKVREKMTVSDPYWDLLKETAAFYARKGDYRAAADIVKRVQTETAGKQLRPVLGLPGSLEARQVDASRDYVIPAYKAESDFAMAEILAMDAWLTAGPDAAAPLLATRTAGSAINTESFFMDRGSDPQRARWLEFATQRAFLQMSILLDGNPSPERIVQAYAALQPVKGRYLDSVAEIARLGEYVRDNPNVSYSGATDPTHMLDELTADRAKHAHLFVAAALDGKTFHGMEFAASEEAEQAVSEGLAYAARYQNRPTAGNPRNIVPPDAAFIDVTAWERIDRTSPSVSHREYGAFVIRKGQPMRFVRLGAAAEIDNDVAALETAVVGPKVRGVHLNPQAQQVSPQETERRLKHLYELVIAPLESSIAGAHRLLIVPDGKLTLAPMDAFIDGQGRYLLQRYAVSYLASFRDLYQNPGASNKTRPSLVVANPDFNALLPGSAPVPAPKERPQFDALPGAESEADDVRQALHITPDRVLVGKAAREELLRSVGGPEILHFATHSVPTLNWKVPMPGYDLFEFPRSLAVDDPLLQSVIVLAGGNVPQTGPEDGLLTGLEVASMRLSGTRLVVLSTCEAGQGVPVDGQGVLGLRAAFSIAGAEGLVMSLWPVDDKAGRLFMQYFYAHLDAGPAEAIRLAQLDMVAKSEYKQPRYWAGYAYSGSPAVNAWHPSAAAAAAEPNPSGESLVAPTCLEVNTRAESGNDVQLYTYRVKIAGAVREVSRTAERVVFNLLPPGSDLEESSATLINHKQLLPFPDVHVASHSKFSLTLTIEKTKDQSSLTIREFVPDGDTRYKPQTVREIVLKGRPAVFPNLEIPSTFPTLASYTEASIARGQTVSQPETVERVGACKQ